MTHRIEPRTLSAIISADWSKEASKRAVYVADVGARSIRRLNAARWSLDGVLRAADAFASTGAVLAAFDVPLGVPESYLAAFGRLHPQAPADFPEFLARVRSLPHFFDATSVAKDWSVDRPFFAVPAGQGGLGTFVAAASRMGVDLYRRIDRTTGAKAAFIKSGVPGSVGSAACALWQEFGSELLTPDRVFKVWPFEGDFRTLLQSAPVVVGEMYPRAAYATALLDEPPTSRSPLVVGKTHAGIRREAITTLRTARWIRSLRVELRNLAEAEANEDDFDACVTAAALLRCVLEDAPLCPPLLESAASEGAILGTGSVNIGLAQRTVLGPGREHPVGQPAARAARPPDESCRPDTAASRAEPADAARVFRCPIAGCDKVFRGSRSGWDAHVGSIRLHPGWHPELREPNERRERFQAEFSGFFDSW